MEKHEHTHTHNHEEYMKKFGHISKYHQLAPITFGHGAIELVGDACLHTFTQRALVVTDKTVMGLGIVDKAVEGIRHCGIEFSVFDGMEKNTPLSCVKEGVNQAREFQADTIVGIGGGSVLDGAKAIARLAAGDTTLEEMLSKPFEKRERLKAVLVATTAGSGSESNILAFIRDYVGKKKIPLFVSPNFAVIDPEVMLGMDRDCTVRTAMDAFSHACECLSGAFMPNPHSDLLAYDAMRRIFQWLPVACEDINNYDARENLAYASSFAAQAAHNTCLHIGHAISYAIEDRFDIEHGIVCAWALPVVAEFMDQCCNDKYHKVNEILHPGECVNGTEGLQEALYGFMRKVALPDPQKLGINRKEFVSCYDSVKELRSVTAGKRKPGDEELKQLIQAVYDGYKCN
jgi:alcohol dehydrogenase class IV